MMKLTDKRVFNTKFGDLEIATYEGKRRVIVDPIHLKKEWKQVKSIGGRWVEYPNALEYFVYNDHGDRYVSSSQGDSSYEWVKSLGAKNYDEALNIANDEVVKCFRIYYNDDTLY